MGGGGEPGFSCCLRAVGRAGGAYSSGSVVNSRG
jgi:hypothetical protein